MKYYFLKTVFEKGRMRVRPLRDQVFSLGDSVNTSFNVQCDVSVREHYPIGTVFGCSDLTDKGVHYAAGKIFPLVPDDQLKSESHKAPDDMTDAYHRFIGSHSTDVDADPKTEFKKTFKAARGKKSKESTEKTTKSFLDKLMANDKYAPPTIEKNGFYVKDTDWYLLIRNILNGINTMMIGPTGTGKTELIILACDLLGIDCHVYDMGSMYDPISGLLGVHRLVGGESVFDYAQFTKDVQTPCVVVLDELSRAPATTNNVLLPCLDSRKALPVEMAGGDDLRSISIHEDCVFFATANVGAEYSGTMSLDRALVGRLFPLELSYMPKDIEARVLSQRCGIDTALAAKITNVATIVRSLYEKQQLSTSISTRETLMAAELVSDGWTVMESLNNTFLPLYGGTLFDGERSVVYKTFTSM